MVKLEVVWTLKSAIFLTKQAGPLEQDCLEFLDEVFSNRPDLTDKPFHNPDLVLYTDGSSYMENKKKMTGYAVVSDSEVEEGEELPQGWSVELWALIRDLELSWEQRVNTYTDLRYAFTTLHVHGALYKERGLLTAGGKGIKTQVKILKLLEVVWEQKELAVVYCKGHHKGGDPVAKGNRQADAATKEASPGSNRKSC